MFLYRSVLTIRIVKLLCFTLHSASPDSMCVQLLLKLHHLMNAIMLIILRPTGRGLKLVFLTTRQCHVFALSALTSAHSTSEYVANNF